MTPTRFRSMGCEVVVGGATADELAAVQELFAERDCTFSRFRKDSELSRVNAFPSRILVVSEAFAGMTRLALWAWAATECVVDPTVGAAMVALGYDRDFDEIDSTVAPGEPAPGGRASEIRVRGRILERPVGVELDLNGVVKSRTVDDALAQIVGPAFVSAGGDLATRGPLDVALPGEEAIRLGEGALATSGTLTRSWWRGGERLHHLVDAATGRPVNAPWGCVTVAARTCVEADVAAKAAFLLGADGPSWLDEKGLPGRLVTEEGAVVVTRAWGRQVAAPEWAAA